ncbi:type IV secretory system conjugative DNA transfer family protein [Chitinophaga tropicalis]|uniref:Type IV secretion system DNA-binding domain-containing protein n=1 Tax=Chitinophaga tropicalis TaxID=2683588 RepID=A0A7K1UDP1_9BACT|nr:type IV secretion system DNA-binding domain-containing protein [Chitinophaga tropicalis]MVT12507.1 type IV secretion system DNA-binding domain-containing protein [Chitinophaga tropicalis]
MIEILITVGYFFVVLIIYSIHYHRFRFLSWAIGIAISVLLLAGIYYYLADNLGADKGALSRYLVIADLAGILYGALYGQRHIRQSKKEEHFYLEAVDGRRVYFRDPLDNFLVYAGANSGKTKSIGKNLLEQYIKHHWAGFVYDFKDGDYSRTTFELVSRYNYPHKVYHANFIDLSCSHRFNIVKPSVLKDPNFFTQLLGDVLNAYMAESKQNEWYLGALGLFRGVGIRFYMDYPQYCTIPHIVNFIAQADNDRLERFLNARPESRGLASAYLSAARSEKTQDSIRSTLGNYLSELSFNKNVQYVLSGDDFDFNLIDPAEPKLLIVANAFKLNTVLSPLISMMLLVSTRNFTLKNRIPCFYFLDEPTTMKVANFQELLSVLREYLVSFALLTQSQAKFEKLYGIHDLRSIESNCGNKFFGKTLDPKATESYVAQFSRREEQRVTKTRGQSTNNSSSSVSVSKAKEQRYDPDFFMQLKPGEFVGRATHSNVKEFHLQFKQYVPGNETDPPIVGPVLERDILNNYNRIIEQVSNLE